MVLIHSFSVVAHEGTLADGILLGMRCRLRVDVHVPPFLLAYLATFSILHAKIFGADSSVGPLCLLVGKLTHFGFPALLTR